MKNSLLELCFLQCKQKHKGYACNKHRSRFMEQHNKANLCCNLMVWSIDFNSEWVSFLNRNFTTTRS